MDPLGPLAVRWSYLPKALPWLISYLLSGWTEARVENTARALRDLLKDAPALHKKLADEADVGGLIERRGVLHVFPSRGDFDVDLSWRIRKRGASYVLSMRLPFADRHELDVHRKGDELYIKVGPYKRNIILPQTLQRLTVQEARFEADRLEVRFAREPRPTRVGAGMEGRG